jgi:hypothetical protein
MSPVNYDAQVGEGSFGRQAFDQSENSCHVHASRYKTRRERIKGSELGSVADGMVPVNFPLSPSHPG